MVIVKYKDHCELLNCFHLRQKSPGRREGQREGGSELPTAPIEILADLKMCLQQIAHFVFD